MKENKSVFFGIIMLTLYALWDYHKSTLNADGPASGRQAFNQVKTTTQNVKSQGGGNTEGIKARRLELGIGQAELARMIGVTPAAVLAWERPDCYPEGAKLPAIADALRCSIDVLYGRVPPKKS